MIFTDTHTHLYDEQLMQDENQVKRAIEAGVTHLYMPNCDSETIPGMLKLADMYPDNCLPMMGLHPCYVKEGFRKELEIVEQQLEARKYYAVGEIGLDYYWDLTYKTEQIDAYEYQIRLALKHQLPIVVHSRESTQDCIDVARRNQTGSLKGIFHCFSGTLAEARQIIDMGLYLGIGGVVTYSKGTLPDIVKEVPLESIVLETDAPYLSPVPHRGKRNESSYIPIIAAKIADLKGLPIEDVARITTENAQKVFAK
jgi:TatD DNase family protein